MSLLHGFGIDMGAGSIKIYDTRSGDIIAEKNMAVVRDGEQVFAVGDDAFAMYEKAPQNMQVITPISKGRISDVMLMEAILHTLLSKTRYRIGLHPTLLFSVPLDLTEIERRAYYSIAHKGRLKRGHVVFVERAFADALASGETPEARRGRMIVNIGADTTEISVLSGGHIIFSHLHPDGGRSIDDAVADAVRMRHQLLISHRASEELKISISAADGSRSGLRQAFGVDSSSGLPRSGTISERTVIQAIYAQVDRIIQAIHRSLDRTPPQIRAIVREEGILLAGGTSRIPWIRDRIAGSLDCPVQIAAHHEMNTVHGLACILQDQQHMERTFGLSR